MMSFGLGVLRLTPHEFWLYTLRELVSAFRGYYGLHVETHPRHILNNLMQLYPDQAQS
jgi:uncharacterized phage protein (TIGR02216 family)